MRKLSLALSSALLCSAVIGCGSSSKKDDPKKSELPQPPKVERREKA